ncbi:DUF7657 domain-containing protein [Christensenella intestinihominis]|uniref:DUF7657 domain-containing protein n=1 Tax=Christensenella intestinihominis TaxID=1851429 RepID=UPI00082C9B39|nr:hypothetical protein [Christensenella intestinihominis]
MEINLKNTYRVKTPALWLALGIGICIIAAYGLEALYVRIFPYVVTEKQILLQSPERWVAFFIFCYYIFLHFVIQPKKIYHFIYKYRFLLAFAVFILCVLLQLHGSSMSIWNTYLSKGDDPSRFQEPIFGLTRGIRSDEWNVFTPLAMSQEFNDYGIVNSISRAWPTDMLTIYNQPVWDITLIAKPFYWGYLLLGSSYGLSWFWAGRMIALFLVTFELFMLLTKGKKGYSVMAAFLISFAPVVQWWFAINFFVEMLVAGQLAILMIYHFMNTSSLLKKALYAFVFALCGLAYIFALYPAWMIPLLYVFAALAVWVIISNFKNGKRRKAEWFYIAGALLMIGGIAAFWYLRSEEAFTLTMNTVYPGSRVYTGGDGIDWIFAYTTNLATPYLSTQNPCEGAMMYGFFPLTEILACIYLFKRKFKDLFVILLMALDIFFLLFVILGAPVWLAKATLLSNTTARIMPIICFIEILIFIKILSSDDEPLISAKLPRAIFILAGIGLSVLAVYTAAHSYYTSILPTNNTPTVYWIAFAAVMSAFMAYFFLNRKGKLKTVFTLCMCLLAFLSGVFVNPVMRTTDAIYDKPLAEAVQEIQQKEPGIWIGADMTSNFLIANGAPTITSTNIFPALERWKVFDETGEKQDIYNRYAHIFLYFTEEETELAPGPSGDTFALYLNPNDLFTLGVDYICTSIGTEIPTGGFQGALTPIYEDGNARIYRVDPIE